MESFRGKGSLWILFVGVYLITVVANAQKQPGIRPPMFVNQPSPQIAYKTGEAVEIPCKASGHPVPSAFLLSISRPTENASAPPRITKFEKREIAYKLSEEVSLACAAEGVPKPTYRWTKDGKDLPIMGLEIRQVPGEGSIVIESPREADEGVYQCFAQNMYGVALSIKTRLKLAVLEPFPTVKEPKTHRVSVGSELKLDCTPPQSYPEASVYWGENRNGSKLKPIENNDRISLDYKGNLYFSNVLKEDEFRKPDGVYCIANNFALRTLFQADDESIIVLGRDPPQYKPPKRMWSSTSPETAIKGQKMKLKCIFSGYPTPRVTWKRLDATMPSKNEITSFGQELTIPDVDFSDTGRYQCQAVNTESMDPVPIEITLNVESSPYWRNDRRPEDVNTSEEEDAVFECQVNGVPKPTVEWFINGVPLNNAKHNPRRFLNSQLNTLTFKNVTKSDAQVIQCNASNPHGYIFQNAYLNVLSEAPSFIETPQPALRVAEGQRVVMTCRVSGAPKPSLAWQKGLDAIDVNDLPEKRHRVLDNGDLEIRNVKRDDAGLYQCYVWNKLGSDVARGQITVSDKTVIIDKPEDQTVLAGANVTFKCNAKTDSTEMSQLVIDWAKDGEKVRGHVKVTDKGRRLDIVKAKVEDSGRYVCTAGNGIDKDSITVNLLVKARPSPPREVTLETCGSTFADVTWSEGLANNDPITSYTLYYNTTHSEPGRNTSLPMSDPTRLAARVQLRPWTEYTFYVTATNSLGESLPSEFAKGECKTKPARPDRNPNLVCTDSRERNTLVIVWEPMIREMHNGKDFRYIVSYRLTSAPLSETREVPVMDWHQSELVVTGQDIYQEYEVSVQAVNHMGAAQGPLNKVIGYSAEDEPLVSPENFQINNSTLNSTSVQFSFSPVDTTMENIRGFFKGYQVEFYRHSDPDTKRKEPLIINQWSPCRQASTNDRSKRLSARGDMIKISTNQLWPYSRITAGVVVLNGAKSGPISNEVTFDTPEGVPSKVPIFWVSERASHHLKLSWTPPEEHNGILQGYIIGYKLAPPEIDTERKLYVEADQTYFKIRELKDDVQYIIFISAHTNAGTGPEHIIFEKTVAEGAPDKPSIVDIVTGYDFVNVSWNPSGGESAPRDPGSDFIVEYRLSNGDTEWNQTRIEMLHNWANVTQLEHGKAYDFRVKALNSRRDTMYSDPVSITVGVVAEPVVHDASSALWFVILLCILLLLIIVIVLILLMRRNRGEAYAVYEKERLHGNKGTLDEEAAFREYFRQEEPTIRKSQGSLESSGSKSEEDDGSDSLGVYEDNDPNKFNEEGSFVDHTATVPEYRKLEESKSSPTDINSPPSVLSTVI